MAQYFVDLLVDAQFGASLLLLGHRANQQPSNQTPTTYMSEPQIALQLKTTEIGNTGTSTVKTLTLVSRSEGARRTRHALSINLDLLGLRWIPAAEGSRFPYECPQSVQDGGSHEDLRQEGIAGDVQGQSDE